MSGKAGLKLVRNLFRYFAFTVIFFWIFSCFYGSYADSINYKTIIKSTDSENFYQKQDEIDKILKNILTEIESKKEKNTEDSKNEWEKILEEIKKTKEKINQEQNKDEKDKLKEKNRLNIDSAKNLFLGIIEKELEKANLKITDLEDKREWKKRLINDPLNFFIVRPLNNISKFLKIEKNFWGDLIFKIFLVKIFFYFITYWETIKFYELGEKMKDENLSLEEKDKIQAESLPFIKYMALNGLFTIVFNFITIFFHPFFTERNNQLYLKNNEWYCKLYFWILPMIIASFISSLTAEFIREKKFLSRVKIKEFLAKSWLTNSFFFILNISLFFYLSSNQNLGGYLISFLSSLMDIPLNLITTYFLSLKKENKQKFK